MILDMPYFDYKAKSKNKDEDGNEVIEVTSMEQHKAIMKKRKAQKK